MSAEDNGLPQNSGLIIGVCSMQGKRPYQEDEYSVRYLLNFLSFTFTYPFQNDTENHIF